MPRRSPYGGERDDMIIRSKTFKAWMLANLKEEMPDIVNHGCAAGFPGLSYYADTGKLYDKFEDEIWDALWDDAEMYGNNIPELIGTFGGAKDVGSHVQFKNLLTWYMAERIAREVTDQ